MLHPTRSNRPLAVLLTAVGAGAAPALAQDLVIDEVDGSALSVDAQLLAVTGTAQVTIENAGSAAAGAGAVVLLFEDLDGDCGYTAGVDRDLGSAVAAGLGAGSAATIAVDVAGSIQFRGSLIYGFVDATDVVPETNETNNIGSTGLGCSVGTMPGQIDATLQWSWTSSAVEPAALNVMMVPAVIDLNGDAVPEVVFGSTASNGGGTVEIGFLRALDGATGAELFTVDDPMLRVNTASSVAAGDIDGDGRPEIIACDATGRRLIAFEDDGTFKWRTVDLEPINWGAPSIADLDGDGSPEVVVGRQVVDATGALLWTGTGGSGSQSSTGPLSIVSDVDSDGSPDVVTGNTVYDASGVITHQGSFPDAAVAVANFDADVDAEIVTVTGGTVRLLDLDGAGAMVQLWSTPIPGGGTGGPPTVADFDGDGLPEIGVAGAVRYAVFEDDGSLKWQATTQDGSSNRTGSSVFDFNGDGLAEVVYRDELNLRIYSGVDGTQLFETPMSSCTWYEYVQVVDVDADGQAEIVAVANRNCNFGPEQGVFVFRATNDDWVPTRPVWNQHSYHITNVENDGTIPANEPINWLTPSGAPYNNFRQNVLNPLNPGAAPDVTASFLRFRLTSTTALARIGNAGDAPAPAGLPVAFYDGDPAGGGALIGSAATSVALAPGEFEDVEVALSAFPAGQLWVAADDDGTGASTVPECDEGNNVHSADVSPFFPYCPGLGCPCGNDAASGPEGCLNSTGMGGLLAVSGSSSVTADDLVLTLFQLPANEFGAVYLGADPALCVALGDGLRGVAPGLPMSYFPLTVGNSGASGTITSGPGLAAEALATYGGVAMIAAGTTWHFQGIYRDSLQASPCGTGFNLTNAVGVNFAP